MKRKKRTDGDFFCSGFSGRFSCTDFPAFFSWRSNQSGDLIPSESYLNGILGAHLQLLSSQPVFSAAASLRHLLNAAVRLANDLVIWSLPLLSSSTSSSLTVESAAFPVSLPSDWPCTTFGVPPRTLFHLFVFLALAKDLGFTVSVRLPKRSKTRC